MSFDGGSSPPIIWAHVADQSDLDGVVEVIDRLRLEGYDCDLHLTGPNSLNAGQRKIHELSKTDPRHLKPSVTIWLDNKLSTRVLAQINRESIPIVLANLNTQSIRSMPDVWNNKLARSSLKPVRFALVQSQADKDYLIELGFNPKTIQVTGVLQGCGLPPSYDATERQEISKALIGCPIWFARGVPNSEIDIVLDAFEEARKSVRKLTLLLDPWDENEASNLANIAKERGLIVHERSVEGVPDVSTQVFVTDGAFERGLWYSLAMATYLGGTINGENCANPLVSVAVGTALIVGPNPPNHIAAFNRVASSKALCQIESSNELSLAVTNCIKPESAAEFAHAGWKMVANAAEGIDRTIDLIVEILEDDVT